MFLITEARVGCLKVGPEGEDFAAEDEVNVALGVHHKSFPMHAFLLYGLTSGLTPESQIR